MWSWRNARCCRETTFNVPTARPFGDQRQNQGRFETGAVEHIDVEKVRGPDARVVDDERFPRADDRAESGASRLEYDIRSRPRPALILVYARRIGLELLTVVRKQREPHALAGHERDNALRERLEGERHIDGAREDLQDGVPHLELLDLVQRRGPRVFVLSNSPGKPADAARRHDSQREHDHRRGDNLDDDDRGPGEIPHRPRHPLDDPKGENDSPDADDRRTGMREDSSSSTV